MPPKKKAKDDIAHIESDNPIAVRDDDPPWLKLAIENLGVAETPDPKTNNETIMSFYAMCGHPDVKSESLPWCAAFAGSMIKSSGYPIPPSNINLAAGSYERYGVKTEPKRGAVGVLYRSGKASWERHVFFYLRDLGNGLVEGIGGNQSNKVSVGKFNKSLLTESGYRWPVKPTAKDLKAAGSEELKVISNLKTAIPIVGGVAGGVQATQETVPDPAAIIPALPPEVSAEALRKASENTSLMKTLVETANGLGTTLLANKVLFATLVSLAVVYVGLNRLQAHRVKRAQQGQSLSNEG